jgi:hypothetical protein
MWSGHVACMGENKCFKCFGKPEGRSLLGRLVVDGRIILERIPIEQVTNSLMLRTFRLTKIPHSAWVADSTHQTST